MDAFSGFHPIIIFTYYLIVLGVSMFFLHPVLMILSLIGSVAYAVSLRGRKMLRTMLLGMLPTCILIAVINPLFSHEGATILFYLKDGNPITRESILYGMAAGMMVAVVIAWFASFQQVMTSDKIMYLFGKAIPAFSLMLSMALRFVPRFTGQIRKVTQAQQCIGRSVSSGSAVSRAGHGMKILSIATTWALENSVETADSMKSRAYGLRGRTNFSIYRFDRRDRVVMFFLLGTAALLWGGISCGWIRILYYPVFVINAASPAAILVYLLYGGLCVFPLILNLAEEMKWRSIRSKI